MHMRLKRQGGEEMWEAASRTMEEWERELKEGEEEDEEEEEKEEEEGGRGGGGGEGGGGGGGEGGGGGQLKSRTFTEG